jgi:hypothetical protein
MVRKRLSLWPSIFQDMARFGSFRMSYFHNAPSPTALFFIARLLFMRLMLFFYSCYASSVAPMKFKGSDRD